MDNPNLHPYKNIKNQQMNNFLKEKNPWKNINVYIQISNQQIKNK